MDPQVGLRRTDDPNWIPLQATRNRWRTHGLNGKRSNMNPCGFSMWNPPFLSNWPKGPALAENPHGKGAFPAGALWTPKMLHHDWGSLVHSGHRFHSPLSCGILWDVWASKSNRTGLKIFLHPFAVHFLPFARRFGTATAGLMCCPSSSRGTQLRTPLIFVDLQHSHFQCCSCSHSVGRKGSLQKKMP